ncbi:MAG: hypothetical protein KGL53_02325, partial [Elusimicrobia bacterium]|nr:hypothetical protein [Elusimicrobiota bacterium]
RALEGDARRPGLLVLSGVLTGFAMGAKYTEVWAAAAGVLVLAAAARRPRAVLLWSAAAAAAVAPWLLKNAVFAGDPVYPFLAGVFHVPAAAAVAGRLTADARGHFWTGGALSWRTWLALPWELFLRGRSPYSFVGPFFMLFAPLCLLARRAPRPARILLALFGIHYVLWAGSTSMARLLLPAMPLFALYAGAALEALPAEYPWAALVLAAAFWDLSWNQAMLAETEAPAAVFGAVSREAFLAGTHYGYPNASAVLLPAVEALPADARLYIAGDARRYPFPRRAEAAGPFDIPRLWGWLQESSSADELARALRSAGFTHLLVNIPELERLWPPPMRALWLAKQPLVQKLFARSPKSTASGGVILIPLQ